MANFGRFICVGIPLVLTVASLIALLVAALAGVTDKGLYIFRLDLTKLSISASDVANIIESRGAQAAGPDHVARFKVTDSSVNVTAADLGLDYKYDISLWGYCYTSEEGSRKCTKPKSNWAEKELNVTKSNFKSLMTATGANLTLPDEISSALSSFEKLTHWTEIVFIIAIISLAVELVFGTFANCSRIFSCITWLESFFTTVVTCAAAGMSTAMAIIVVAAVDSAAKKYGVKADFNTRFLAAVWISAACAIGAGLFWVFSACCCAPDRSRGSKSKRGSQDESEKFIPTGSYQPIYEDPHSRPQPVSQFGYANNSQAPRRDLAYEPYSHANV